MATPVRPEATLPWQPPAHSLEFAAAKLEGLLSATPEKEETPKPPEQSPPTEDTPSKVAASATEQASAAPEQESEQTQATEQESPPPPQLIKVKVNGQEIEVPVEEAAKGYSRTEDYTRKTQQLSQERKAFETEMQQVRAERAQYLNGLTSMEQALKDMSPAEPNWNELKQRLSPDQFADQMLSWRENQRRLSAIADLKARTESQQMQDAIRLHNARVSQEEELLVTALPEFADPTTGPELKSSLYSYAKGMGFTDDMISSATTDHKVVLLLHKAMLHDQAQAKKPVMQNKIEKVLTTAAPGNRQPPPPKSKYNDAMSRLQKSGSTEDAAKAIEALLG